MAPNDFNGQIALVTGGGSGIGRATCLQLARDGARVVVTDISVEAARETLSLMHGPEHHLALQMDVTQRSAVEGVIVAAQDRFGEPPSLLVNCAGIALTTPFLDVTDTSLDTEIDVNLKGTFLVTQAFVKALLEENKEAEEGLGAIVNIASMLGKKGHPDFCVYSATKGGVIALSKSCAAEMARKGIRVNCVLPGLIDTPMTKDSPKTRFENYNKTTPLGRCGRPEEVAEVVVFLLSRRSSYMVGACVEISGGSGM